MKVATLLSSACLVVLVAADARADVLPEGMQNVPVQITLDGQDALGDARAVVLGCAAEPRHAFTIAKPGDRLECHSVKRALDVRAVAAKDVKALDDLRAKDVGWGQERVEAEKLASSAPSCGKIEITSLVETKKNVDHLAATYRLAKAASGCSLEKVGDVVSVPKGGAVAVTASASGASAPSASAAAAPSTSAAAAEAPSASPSASAAPTSAAAPPASTGGCSRCAIVPFATNGAASLAVLAAFVVGLAQRRRSRRRDER